MKGKKEDEGKDARSKEREGACQLELLSSFASSLYELLELEIEQSDSPSGSRYTRDFFGYLKLVWETTSS